MTTAEMEAEVIEVSAEATADIQVESGTVQPIGDAAEPDPPEVARAEAEGMVDVPPPTPPPTDEPSTKQKLEDAEREVQIEEAMEEVCTCQEAVDEKWYAFSKLDRQAKDAKKAAEAADVDLNDASRRLRLLREGRFPDAEKYPMFDKPADATDADKARVDAMFPKPEPIPPVPANLEAFQAVRARETTLASLGFGKRLAAKLEAAGFATVADLRDKSPDALGLTEKQREELDETMTLFWVEVGKVWQADHPEDADATPHRELSDSDVDALRSEADDRHPPDTDSDMEDIEDQGHEYDGMEGGE